MSRYPLLALTLLLSLIVAGAHAADPKNAAEKSPADLAADAFFKLRDAKDAPPTPERQAKVLEAGIAFLKDYPASGRAGGVMNSLATFGATIKDKKQAAQRTAWYSRLQYEAFVQASKAEAGSPAATAFTALLATTAGAFAKEVPNGENIAAFREKIDRLAPLPESTRFLSDQERTFIQLLKMIRKVDLAEKHANALLASKDKRVAGMAKQELKLIEIAKQPLELTFTALDGKQVDLAQLRGKVVYFYFWATTGEGSTKDLLELKNTYAEFKKEKFELIAVSLDTAADKAQVEKFVKSNKLVFPVWYAGTGTENELGERLNISKPSSSALFDANGMFVATGVRSGSLGGQLKKMLGIK